MIDKYSVIRAAGYSTDPAFVASLEKLLSNDFDILSIEQDERIRHVCDILSGGHLFKNHHPEQSQLSASSDEDDDEDIEYPPPPNTTPQTDEQREALEMKAKGNDAFVAKNLNEGLFTL